MKISPDRRHSSVTIQQSQIGFWMSLLLISLFGFPGSIFAAPPADITATHLDVRETRKEADTTTPAFKIPAKHLALIWVAIDAWHDVGEPTGLKDKSRKWTQVAALNARSMGPWEHTGMAVAAETRQQWLDDVVNTVGNSFLGLEMCCFKCHDHKFDPLPTRDYYALQAVFAPTQFADVAVPFTPDEQPAALPEAEKYFRQLAQSCERRSESIVVTQASTLMNGDFSNTRSLALADRISRSEPERPRQISELYSELERVNRVDALPGHRRLTRLHRLIRGDRASHS